MTKENLYLQTARCYSNTFRGAPWNEAFKNSAGEFKPLEGNEQSWRNQGYTLAYPLIETSFYIDKEVAKPDSVYVERKLGNRVIAFAWGFSVTDPTCLVEEKWLPAADNFKQDMIRLIRNNSISQQLWYLSEVGVDPRYQGQGLGKAIVSELLAQSPEDMSVIMRTNVTSPMTQIAKQLGMYQILGPTPIRRGNQIQADYQNTVNGIDPVNPQRVVYVLLQKGGNLNA